MVETTTKKKFRFFGGRLTLRSREEVIIEAVDEDDACEKYGDLLLNDHDTYDENFDYEEVPDSE